MLNHLEKIILPGLFQLFSFEPTGPKGGQLRAGIYSSAAEIDSNTISMNEVGVILTGDLGKTELRNSVFEDNVYLLGRRVFVLDREFQSAGYKTFNWRADNLASGVCFCRLSAEGIDGDKFMKTKKMVIISRLQTSINR